MAAGFGSTSSLWNEAEVPFPLGIEDCRPREETCVVGRPIEIQQQPIVFAEWMALPNKILS